MTGWTDALKTVAGGAGQALLATTCAALPITAAAAERPNLVVILADDLGWSDLACYGNPVIKTPNLDRLAQQGLRFTQAYSASPVCGPTRACLMTGLFPARVGATNWGGCSVPGPMTTLPEALHEGGYPTWFIGKWHLGDQPNQLPDRNGFDLNLGGSAAGQPKSYLSPYQMPHLTDGPKGEYLTDRLTDEAITRINQAAGRPFLLYLAHYAVHLPVTAKPEDSAPYQKSYPKANPKLPAYAGMVANLDHNVGRVLHALDQNHLADSTLVVFLSDNGGYFPEGCSPLRGTKGSCWEGGIRVPMIVRWPGKVKPGTVSEQPVISADLYPTLLEAAGLPLRPQQHRDGRSLVGLLRTGAALPERPLVWHFPHGHGRGGAGSNTSAIRLGRWKLIHYHQGTPRDELYDLQTDDRETTDVSARNPAIAAALAQRLTATLAEMAQEARTCRTGNGPTTTNEGDE